MAAPVTLKGIDNWKNKKANDALIDDKNGVSDAKIAKLNEKRESLYMNEKTKILGVGAKQQPKKSRKFKGNGFFINQKPKILAGDREQSEKSKGEGLYMNQKPKIFKGA